MRARVFLPMFLIAVPLLALAGEEKKEIAIKLNDAIKVDLSYLEKTWGIKYKSYKVKVMEVLPVVADKVDKRPGDFKGGRGVVSTLTFLLEFTKDVENLKELREALTPRPGNPAVAAKEGLTPRPGNSALWFYCFDDDNVAVFKLPPGAIEGEVTGKKGDAIRLSVEFRDAELKITKIRKIEARPGEKEQDKKSKYLDKLRDQKK